MSWWRRLLGLGATAEPAPAPPPSMPPPASIPPPGPPPSGRSLHAPLPATSEVAALRKLRGLARGEPLDDIDAVAALRAMAGTTQEKDALEAVRKAARTSVVSEALRVVAAELFSQRGEHEEALAMLGRPTSIEGLSLRAEAQAALGDLAGASASLERVLARDIAAPGVRERLVRWRARLGLPLPGVADAAQDGTLFTSAQPSTPFRIVSEAGRGGAAVIYEAFDEALGRALALKVYHRPADNREQIEREACLAAEASGPGVVRVYDADLDAGWLALEWASGATLREHLRQRELAWLLPVDAWLDPLLAALARIHRLGWAHGDIKPGNVLFRSPGHPLLTDFGLARRPGEAWTGGTVGFLSPERLANRPVSLADDIYAVGRLLEDVVSALGDEAPPSLHALAERCLAEGRPQDAVVLLAERKAQPA